MEEAPLAARPAPDPRGAATDRRHVESRTVIKVKRTRAQRTRTPPRGPPWAPRPWRPSCSLRQAQGRRRPAPAAAGGGAAVAAGRRRQRNHDGITVLCRGLVVALRNTRRSARPAEVRRSRHRRDRGEPPSTACNPVSYAIDVPGVTATTTPSTTVQSGRLPAAGHVDHERTPLPPQVDQRLRRPAGGSPPSSRRPSWSSSTSPAPRTRIMARKLANMKTRVAAVRERHRAGVDQQDHHDARARSTPSRARRSCGS